VAFFTITATDGKTNIGRNPDNSRLYPTRKLLRWKGRPKMDDKNSDQPENSQLIIYQSDDGKIKIDVRFQGETVWLSQKLLAELFQVSVPTINEHIKTIYEDKELEAAATIRKFLIVQAEGARQVSRQVDFYNLDMIISVGYRVKSLVATRFRIWATQRLREYIVKGFTLDDERLKNPDQPFDIWWNNTWCLPKARRCAESRCI